jgi:hypothetical protein
MGGCPPDRPASASIESDGCSTDTRRVRMRLCIPPRLAPSYAPELDLTGAAAMAPPTDLGDLVDRDDNEQLGIILTSLAVTSWSTLYPDQVDERTIVPEEARPFVAGYRNRCIGTIGDGTGQVLVDLPEVAALDARFLSADPATAPGWSTMLEDNFASGTTIGVRRAGLSRRARPTECHRVTRCAAVRRRRRGRLPNVSRRQSLRGPNRCRV